MNKRNWMPAALIRIAAVYFVAGVTYGVVMGMTGAFTTAPVHAHLNLLGWVSLGMAGTIYRLWPDTLASRLASWHFWLHNTGLPVLMIALYFLLTGHPQAEPVVGIASLTIFAGIICFAVNLWRNAKPLAASSA